MRLEVDYGDGYEHFATFHSDNKRKIENVVELLNQNYEADFRTNSEVIEK